VFVCCLHRQLICGCWVLSRLLCVVCLRVCACEAFFFLVCFGALVIRKRGVCVRTHKTTNPVGRTSPKIVWRLSQEFSTSIMLQTQQQQIIGAQRTLACLGACVCVIFCSRCSSNNQQQCQTATTRFCMCIGIHVCVEFSAILSVFTFISYNVREIHSLFVCRTIAQLTALSVVAVCVCVCVFCFRLFLCVKVERVFSACSLSFRLFV